MEHAGETNHSHSEHGVALLNDPTRNKGTAFTPEERREFGLEGLLPRSVDSVDRQVERPRDIRAWIEGKLYKPEY
jgi:malate dehydrogenase (oxaloacetate-decarboxylating)(NADP+)